MVKQFIQKNREVFTEDSSGNVALRAVLEETTGDLTVNGDLTVTGSSNIGVGGTLQDPLVVDGNDNEMFLVRSDNDSGNTFFVNTNDYTTTFQEGSTGNDKSLTVNPVASQINVHTGGGSGDEPILFAPSTSINDDPYGTLRVGLAGVEVLPGTGSDAVTHPLQVNDTNQNSIADFRKADTTVFYNGIDAGPIQAAEDTYQQLIDQNITSALNAGDQVGYTFAVDNNAVVEVSAEADGSGGTQKETLVSRNARQHNRVTVSSAQTLGFNEYVSADTTGGSFTLTLPSVGSEDDGHAIHIKRNGANSLTVDASDSDTVDDATSVTFTSDNEAKTFIYNHSNTDWEEF